MVQFHRLFGGWPVAEWSELSEEDCAEFWRQAAVKTKKDLKELVFTTLLKRQTILEGGKFESP
eukprot:2459243-Lingulodinium_polyedra.AAC.1